MTDEPDWVEDENLSPEETLARFDALRPKPTTGGTGTLTGGTTWLATWPAAPVLSLRWAIRDKATRRVVDYRSSGPVDGPLDDGYEYVWRLISRWRPAPPATSMEET